MKLQSRGILLFSLTLGLMALFASGALATEPTDTRPAANETTPAMAFSLDNMPVSASLFPEPETSSTGAGLQIGSKYPVTFTGFLKADLIYSDGQTNSSDAPRFAVSGGDDDEQFDMTVQHSRLIANWEGPEIAYDGKVDAKLEMDFFTLAQDSVAGSINNSRIRVRQLYINMNFDSWSFLAGQAWDLFSPNRTASLNTNGDLWFGGNAGFRRPQFRLTRWFDVSDDQQLTAAVSVNSNIGIPDPTTGAFNTGSDSGKPVVQGSVQYSLPFLTENKTTIGASGLWGEEEVDGVDSSVDQTAYGFDLHVPITDIIAFKGEWQHGENGDGFLMGAGFDGTGDEFEANAGWGQLTIDATEDVTFNLIAGQERIQNAGAGARSQNTVYAANVKYSLGEGVTVGAEFQRFDTEYNGASDEEVNLGWLSVIFGF